MEISKLPKDEVLSHTSEIITSQENVIKELQQQQTVLFVVVSLLFLTTLI